MAQHILIKDLTNKNMQNIFKIACIRFKKGLSSIRSSLKFQEIYEKSFKESENDHVFVMWRMINKNRETFEIHFDSQKQTITNLYIVK